MPLLADEEDTRKVQTAVAGSPGADHPVYLPMDGADFDRFIRAYPAREFYCGTLLGGCGRKLSARKYRDKKCHFAHVVSGHCRRVSTNEASADHLYIGRALAAWMKEQKYKNVQVRYKRRGQSLREVVDVTYTHDGDVHRHLVRVQLARRSKADWESTDAELHGQLAGVQWLFGPDSMLANWQMDRQGYAIRIQCRPLGVTRVVEVGVQFPDSPVEWVSLSQCRMTAHGIQAPALELTESGLVPRGRKMPSPTRPVVRSQPAEPPAERHTEQPPSARSDPAPALAAPESTRSGPPPSALTLDRIRAWEDRETTERLIVLLDHLDQVGDDLHLDQMQTVLRKVRAYEEALWHRPGTALRVRVATWRAHAAAMAARPTFREICACAELVRWTLGMAARTGRPLTWTELGARLDARLPALHPDDKVSILVEADRGTCSDRPLLAALVAARGDRVHPLYADVLDHLDRPVPAPEEAQASWEEDLRSHRRDRRLQGEQFVITNSGASSLVLP
ncbi:competence protein CoiA family protein [Streptomyces sp. MK5]|uniref:competence protein CoiA family protein n=1 Tax=Streptomyces sp. MK5 TaxID=3064253 RepID=UPI002741E688|nr:competence protein CoiA family protein [Streptomyces sp. MK5]